VDEVSDKSPENMNSGGRLWDRASSPDNPQGISRIARVDYRIQSGNPSGISQSEDLTTGHNFNLASASLGCNLINDSPMLVNLTSEKRQQQK